MTNGVYNALGTLSTSINSIMTWPLYFCKGIPLKAI